MLNKNDLRLLELLANPELDVIELVDEIIPNTYRYPCEFEAHISKVSKSLKLILQLVEETEVFTESGNIKDIFISKYRGAKLIKQARGRTVRVIRSSSTSPAGLY